uniref:Uncharacterized protein n=1 Tax=Anguilla anguilla TaxID=7936 RepID=A0A0E9XP27_ANGAN
MGNQELRRPRSLGGAVYRLQKAFCMNCFGGRGKIYMLCFS